MRSATDFLPCFMIEFMNLDTTKSLYFGSGLTSRLSALFRRDMCSFLRQSVLSQPRWQSRASSLTKPSLQERKKALLGPLRSVLGAPLLPVGHALRVEHAADDVIADTGQVLDAAAADHHHRV